VNRPETFSGRIGIALNRADMDEEDLERESGVNQRTLKRYLEREDPPESGRSVPTVQSVADSLGVTVSWLRTGEGEMLAPSAGDGAQKEARPVGEGEAGEALPSAMRYVPLVGVNAHGGDGEVPFDVRVERQVAYDTRQLRSSGIDASRAVLIRVTGDSMKPTLAPGDGLLVERYAGEPLRDGTIYVLRQRDHGVVVKRLYWTDDKTLELRSDNPDGPTLTMDPENENDWDVIGRVARVEKAL
jgi:phage repressor protein C with HTH and peptisase S24 domain